MQPEPFQASVPLVWLTIRDLAARLQCSDRNVRRLATEGRIPPGRMIGGLRRWHIDEVRAWETGGAA